MSTAKQNLNHSPIEEYTVASGQSATKGYLAILSGADDEVDDAGAGSDLGIGVFLATATAGKRVAVAMGGIVPVKVGTGAATRGKKAKFVADGFTDAAAHDSSGTTDDAIYGVFMQSGVLGDVVGLLFYPSNRGAA